MKKIIVTNYKDQSYENFNIIWDSYSENKNSFSLIRYIENNSKKYKKNFLNEIQGVYDAISKNYIIKKKLLIDKNFNFLDTFLISEKSFYKDKYGNLSDVIKCVALIDKISLIKTDEIIFNIGNKNVYCYLKKYCELNNIKLTVKNKIYFQFYIFRLKFFFSFIYSFLSFIKFILVRSKIPKSSKASFNNKNIFFDYFCYFDKKKFTSGKYVSNYWGNLPEKIKLKKDLVFFHIFMENNNLQTNKINKFIDNFNNKKGEKHFIIDSFLNFLIILNIYKKWLYFFINYFFIKNEIINSLKLKKKYSYPLFTRSITDNLIGFNCLLNLYYYYLFSELFKKKVFNFKNKNIFYLCENQGWEKILLSLINVKKEKTKVYPVISTPVRFWDLRYNFLKHELKNFKIKIAKFLVMSFLSKQILKKNKFNNDKISIVESLRYESLNQKKIIPKKIQKNTNSILIIGDYLESVNKNIENFSLRLLEENKKINIIAKPHPSKKFSSKFNGNLRIKITNENIHNLSTKTNFCICSNMTSASYDLLYLNFNLLVLLANDSINFSPLKNFKGINYAYDATNINIMKIKKNVKNLDFRKNAFLFDKNYKNWSKYLK